MNELNDSKREFKEITFKTKLNNEKQDLEDVDVIDLAMNNLNKNGVRREDTLEYLIDKGMTTHKAPLTDEEREILRKTEIQRGSVATQKEITRIYIKECLKEHSEFLGDDIGEFKNLMIDQYNQGKGSRITLKLLKSKFDLPPKEARAIYESVMKKASILTNWKISKDRNATYFTIFSPYSDKYDGQEFPIDDFEKYVPFMVENNASPRFYGDKKRSEELRKLIRVSEKKVETYDAIINELNSDQDIIKQIKQQGFKEFLKSGTIKSLEQVINESNDVKLIEKAYRKLDLIYTQIRYYNHGIKSNTEWVEFEKAHGGNVEYAQHKLNRMIEFKENFIVCEVKASSNRSIRSSDCTDEINELINH